jgi:pimeloyl-ACP methyl ester carboxylesterase
LLDHLGIANISFCGLSVGGLVGQWLGLHAAERLKKLVLCNTAAHWDRGYMEFAYRRRKKRWTRLNIRKHSRALVYPALS